MSDRPPLYVVDANLTDETIGKPSLFRAIPEGRWSLLTALGNSPIAKLSLASPIIAGIIRFKEEFVRVYILPNFQTPDLVAMYWALIALSASQLLYLLCCPREIKKYGSDRELYILEQNSTLPLKTKFDLRDSYVRSFFNKNKPSLRMPFELIKEFTNTARDQNKRTISSYNIGFVKGTDYESKGADCKRDIGRMFMFLHGDDLHHPSYPKQMTDAADNSNLYPVILALLKKHGNLFTLSGINNSMSEVNKSHESYKRLTNFLDVVTTTIFPSPTKMREQKDWFLELQNWNYDRLNKSRKFLFYLTSYGYTLGGGFFIFQSIKTMLYVAKVTH